MQLIHKKSVLVQYLFNQNVNMLVGTYQPKMSKNLVFRQLCFYKLKPT